MANITIQRGKRGKRGKQGEPGPQGEDGVCGPMGMMGPTGKTGVAGPWMLAFNIVLPLVSMFLGFLIGVKYFG